MARSFEEIYAEIQEKQAASETGLADLNSTSQVSMWGLIKKMFALLVLLFETRVDYFMEYISTVMDAKEKGDLYYYVSAAKKWQYGDAFIVTRTGVSYTTISTTNQIISQASASEIIQDSVTKVVLKVVKPSGTGGLIPLTTNEITSLTSYIDAVKWAGIAVLIRSQVADVLKLNITVKVNRAVGNLDGTLISNPTFRPVDSANVAFVQSLPFDSIFRWRDLETALRSIEFVSDCAVTASWINGTAVTLEGISEAGHFTIDPNSVISYV